MNIKEKVMSQVLLGKINPNTQKYALLKITIEKTLEEVGKLINESVLKDMNDSGCSCGSFFNFIDGKFICNGCQEECENKFYEELKKEIGR